MAATDLPNYQQAKYYSHNKPHSQKGNKVRKKQVSLFGKPEPRAASCQKMPPTR
jgi:hypothetical protein